MSGAEHEVRGWIDAHIQEVAPLERASNLAAWEAATTGSEAALQRSAEARAALRRLYSSEAGAAAVRAYLASPGVRDPMLRRELRLLELAFAGNQLPAETLEELTRREAGLEQVFYSFRPEFEGQPASNNQLLEVLRTERDSARRRAAWEAGKAVAREIAEPLRELVRRRNAAAGALGYHNFYSMELALQEIDEDALFRRLDDFRRDTDGAFARLRVEQDAALAAKFGVEAAELRPWHWEDLFGQEAPGTGGVDLDRLFTGRDLVAIARDHLRSMELPVDDVLERSDLFEREGKDQHAFCTDIDRSGDVRVLCNLRDNERWMSTLLHELGHAAYDKFIPGSLPYTLRSAAHTMTTEAVAMLLGRLTRDPAWLQAATGAALSDAEAADIRAQMRATMLVSARWMLVMAYFERELYRNPERSDLGGLWWELVERIQMVRRPEGRDEPDWAAKIHLSLAPVYYHNYLLGEMTASQLAAAVSGGNREPGPARTGRFLRERIFARGAALPWDDLMAEATGESLSPRHFVAEFV